MKLDSIIAVIVALGTIVVLGRALWKAITRDLSPFEVDWDNRLLIHQSLDESRHLSRRTVFYRYKRWAEELSTEHLLTKCSDYLQWEVHGRDVAKSRYDETLASTIIRAGGYPRCIFRIDTRPYEVLTRRRRGKRLILVGGHKETHYEITVLRFAFDDERLKEWLVKENPVDSSTATST